MKMTTFKGEADSLKSEADQYASNDERDMKDNIYKEFMSNRLKEYLLGDEPERLKAIKGETMRCKKENELARKMMEENTPNPKSEFDASRKDEEDKFRVKLTAMKDSKLGWDNEKINNERKPNESNERVYQLEKQLEAQKISHDREIHEITKSFEGELLKAIEMQESERQLANKRILDRSKYEVENHMLQFQIQRHHDESKRLHSIIEQLEKEKLQLQRDFLELHSLNDRTLLEATTAKEEFGETLSKLKESFSRDTSSLENDYLEKIKRVSDEKDLITNLLEEKSDTVLEMTKRIKCLETEVEKIESQLTTKEEEIISYFEKCSEKDSRIASQQEKLDHLTLQKNCLDNFVISQEKQREALTAQISDLTKRHESLQSLFKISEEHKIELGKKLIACSGELASSQEFVDQLKSELQSLTSQLKRNQETSLKEQENFEMTVNGLAKELSQEREIRKNELLQAKEAKENLSNDNEQLREMLTNLEKEKKALLDRMLHCNRLEDDLEVKLECEQQLRTKLEMKLDETECEFEMTKLVNSELTETINAAESTKLNYEQEIELKAKILKELESLVCEKDKSVSNSEAMIKLLRNELNQCETKRDEFENEYKLAKEKVKKLEKDHERLVTDELRMKCKEVDVLEHKLDEALYCRKMQSEAILELEKQLEMIKLKLLEKEKEVAALLERIQGKDEMIYRMKQKQKTFQKEHGESSGVVKALSSQAMSLKKENDYLRAELQSRNEILEDLRHQLTEERKQNEMSINKSSREKNALESLVLKSKSNLEVCQRRLEKELEWRKKSELELRRSKDASDKNILKMSNLEETISNQIIDHREMVIRHDYLARENSQLRDALNEADDERLKIERWKREQIPYFEDRVVTS